MRDKKTVYVMANHVSEKYCFAGDVEGVANTDGWYAHFAPFGCSRAMPTLKEAIIDMLTSHGCTSITVTEKSDAK